LGGHGLELELVGDDDGLNNLSGDLNSDGSLSDHGLLNLGGGEDLGDLGHLKVGSFRLGLLGQGNEHVNQVLDGAVELGLFLGDLRDELVNQVLNSGGHVGLLVHRLGHKHTNHFLHVLSHALIDRLVKVHLRVLSLDTVSEVTSVLAGDTGGGVLGLTDLEHGVLVVNTVSFTLLADVVVVTLGALVHDANDGVSLTSITDEALVDHGRLTSTSGAVSKALLKATSTDFLDFGSGISYLLVETVVAEMAGTLAESTVLAVGLLEGSFAFAALDVVVSAGLFLLLDGGSRNVGR